MGNLQMLSRIGTSQEFDILIIIIGVLVIWMFAR